MEQGGKSAGVRREVMLGELGGKGAGEQAAFSNQQSANIKGFQLSAFSEK